MVAIISKSFIETAERIGPLPLSFAQQRLWFLAQMEGVSHAYHVPIRLKIKGNLVRVALRQALQRIIARHEALRTRFVSIDGEAAQLVIPVEESRFQLTEHDLRQAENANNELERLVAEEARGAFDLGAGPLIRGRLIRLADAEYMLSFIVHHIVFDGWSISIFFRELTTLYAAFSRGEADPLPPLTIQYGDYAVWQRRWMEDEILKQSEYWKSTLAGVPELLQLPIDHARPIQQNYAGAFVELRLNAKLTTALKVLSKRHKTTLYMTLLAGWTMLLSRLSGEKDIVTGSPVANRRHAEIEGLIGFFVNTLVLRLDLSGSPTVGELLQRIKKQTLAAQQHQDISFEQIVELVKPSRSLAHSPLVQVAFSWQNGPENVLRLPGLEIEPLRPSGDVVAKFDLTLVLRQEGESIVGKLDYATSLFERSTIERYLTYFHTLLEAMAADDNQIVDHISLLPAGERQQVLYEWNDTVTTFPSNTCLHYLFEAQVEKSPESVAAVYEDSKLSYGELNRKANQLAHYLKELGVTPDTRVALCLERGLEMIVALLAVLKAGGAYVPLDPSYPAERLRFMLDDSAPAAVLTQQQLRGLFEHCHGIPVIDLADAAGFWREYPESNPAQASIGLIPENLAYIIYTSGSTGQPKGVMVEHRNVSRLFSATDKYFKFQASDTWCLFHSYAFDFSVWELWGALLYGGRLVIVPKAVARSTLDFYKLVCQEGISILNQTPSAFRQLISAQLQTGEQHRLSCVIFGGEALEVSILKPWYKLNTATQTRLVNMYGITETTVHVTYKEISQLDVEKRQTGSPIGRPLCDLKVYILDGDGEPVPIGVVGELHVGGAGVARGYLHRPELTAGKFIADRFSLDPGARLYRTGDLGRWLPDGSLEFLSRNDSQVKIRGFRIELGEIEARLSEQPGVSQAVVIAREDVPGDKRLVAYYVPDEANAFPVLQTLRLRRSSDIDLYELPNGMRVSSQNKAETDFLYREIFESESYVQRGISLDADSYIFDVGANIGMFTLFVNQRVPTAIIYAFEPVPAIFKHLHINTSLYQRVPRVFNCGLGKEPGVTTFTWYPQNSVLPDRSANSHEEHEMLRAFLQKDARKQALSEEELRCLIDNGLRREQVICEIRTISSIIAKEKINRIDLLKIDVEESELKVLQGIEERDWSKIRQIVLAVHDIGDRLKIMTELLENRGYQISVDQDAALRSTNVYNVYARIPTVSGLYHLSPPQANQGAVFLNSDQLGRQIKADLTARLPEYMVPAAFVPVDAFPLTANGKLDRRALPSPEADAYGTGGYAAPQGERETRLAAIWAELLKVERVGREDNFFMLGGHSLLAITLIERMQQSGFGVDVRSLFVTPTLRALAAAASFERRPVEAPPNRIPLGCEAITPEMLTLVKLTQAEVEKIASAVPGGAANVQDIYPLAPLQEGILFHHVMGGEGDPYVIAGLTSFDQRAGLNDYLCALRCVIERHDTLRTAVLWEGLTEPVQVVWRSAPLAVEEIELDAAAGDVAEQLYTRFHPRRYRMDVRQAPLLRLYVAYDGEKDRWLMLQLLHHLIDDHTTAELMQQEVQAHLAGEEAGLPAPLPFRNLVAQARLGVSQQEHEAFFRQMLGDVEEPTAPFGLLNVQGGSGIEYARVDLEAALARQLRESARRLGVSAASLFHLAWAQVLAKICGREDVVFGTVLFGRLQGGEGAERAMGLFMNTLPVRIRIGEQGAEASVRSVHSLLADLLRHEHASLALAQRCSAVPAPTPLFSSVLNYRHNRGAGPLAKQRRGMQGLRIDSQNHYPLTLSVNDLGEGFALSSLTFASIGPARICQFMERALTSLAQALESFPAAAVRRLAVLPAAEREQVLYGWNETAAEFPSGACLHELFEAQVDKSPDTIAVVYEDRRLSYGELNRQANQLAHYLRELRVAPDVRVALCLERSLEMVVALLAVLKAGGAYVPLDPGYPAERLRFLLKDSAPAAVLTQAHLRGLFDHLHHTPVLDLTEAAGPWQRYPENNSDRAGLTPQHLAYVIYTSGSTGQPKGVLVEHRSVVNYAAGIWQKLRLPENSSYGLLSTLSADLGNTTLVSSLLHGGVLHILRREECMDANRFAAYCGHHVLDCIKITPSHFRALLGDASDASQVPRKCLIFGGETLPEQLLNTVASLRPECRLFNHYGPTETTIGVLAGEITPSIIQPFSGKTAPLGRPIANTQVYILDAHGEPVPAGVTGELYIGGAGVARGYLNRLELTAERFLRDPFSREPGARMYRTGDLGRWLPDGNIEFLGRNDFQVKIRGFRIELGEIEARLKQARLKNDACIRDAVVIAREDTPGDKRLVAYYTLARKETSIDASELRSQLAATLPEYMVPAAFVPVETFPLTPNGKLDRRALPSPEADAYGTGGYEAARGEREIRLAAIWAELLKVERIGREDNFFMLGGHSLLAITLIERMQQSGFGVDVHSLFATPTLRELAAAASFEQRPVEAPPNRIPLGCETITPEMLPLLKLTQAEVEKIVSVVPGGAANVQDIYPLAPLQEGILFHHLMGGEGDPYVIARLSSFEQRTRLDDYLRALQRVIERHDTLRTAVLWEGLTEPVQVVWRSAPLAVEEIELEATGGDRAEQLYTRFHPRRHRIDVRQAPLLRVYVAYDGEKDRWLMLQLQHHLTGDHTTSELMQQEVQAHLAGEEAGLPAPLPFRNLVAQARLGVPQQEHEAFFRQLLGDVEEPTAPFGRLDAQEDGRGIEQAHGEVAPELAQRLRESARRLGVSAASLFHLAWAQVLAKACGREDVVFGTVLFGRLQGAEGAERAMGLFMNTLPVRIRIGEQGAEASVRSVHSLLADLLRHEHASLALAQRCSAVPAPLPLFSSLLNYRHSQGMRRLANQRRGMQGLRVESQNNYPLTLSVDDLGKGFVLSGLTFASIGPARVCQFMERALASLVEALESSPAAAMRTLAVLPAAEREQVLYGWNETAAEFPSGACLHELFEAQVDRSPDAIAVVYEDRTLSYGELNRQANQLAHHLRELRVAPDVRVALCLERSLEMVVALLAVLKAGGAYVPLDPGYPAERLRFLLKDSAPAAVLTQAPLRGLFDHLHHTPVLDLTETAGPWQRYAENNPDRAGLTPQHLAYVIYTSGSTGQPKGVLVEHRSVVNRLIWMQNAYALDRQEAVLQKTPFGFDVSVWEFFWPLLSGAQLILARPEGHKDATYLAATIERNAITTLHFVPSMLQAFLDHGGAAQDLPVVRVVCSGEALPAKLVQRFYEELPQATLYNLYGPTETTVDVTAWTCPRDLKEGTVPIGRPIANTQMYILDAQGEPVPVGVTGELYIGGVGVARGYLNRPELTAERFLRDPFSREPGARMYRTGDLGRWLPDGNIEFLGRNDFQVKLRGFRIELGEIEARLKRDVRLREAVVIAREDTPGDKRLVAYYTLARKETSLDAAELRSYLAATLPEYMVPAAFVPVEAFPLTPNGKLDRRALPPPEADAYAVRGYEAPEGEIETTLATIWAELLKVEQVGRNDNFFELGGHSLLALRLVERIRSRGLAVDVRTLFQTPTLADLAIAVGSPLPTIEVPPNLIPPRCDAITPEMLPLVRLTVEEIQRIVARVPGGAANVQDIYPLAPLQEGILFHHLMDGEGDPYLLAGQIAFDSRARLEEYLGAMRALIGRHDILRTAVIWEGLAEPVQVVWRTAVLPIEEVTLDPESSDAAKQFYERFNPRRQRIDVQHAPLLRVYIAYDSFHDRWLMIKLLHHLAGDHTTLELMQEEIQAHLLGKAAKLPAALPFRNLVARARLGVSREEHEAFFRQMLGDVEEVTAPFGLINVRGDGTGIEEARIPVDPDLALRIRESARKLKVTAASLFHLAWARLLAELSERDDVVFGTVLFGRMQGGEGADRVMGLFMNTLPVRISVGQESVESSVRNVHSLLTDLLRHEHASLVLAQRCSAVAAPTPLFSALLNYRHSARASQASLEKRKRALEGIQGLYGEERTNYPLTLSVDDLGDGYSLTAQIERSIEPRRICAYMNTVLESLVDALVTSPAAPVHTLKVLGKAERRQVLYEWNDTAREFPSGACIHELFETQVEKIPVAPAVVYEDSKLSYGELNRKANQLAHYLRELGVAPDARVAICLERSLDMIVSLLAVLKAGGAYVPLDPSYPIERLRFMLEDSAPAAVLTQSHLRGLFDDLHHTPVLDLTEAAAPWQQSPQENPDRASVGLTPEHLAYVIYTSGSTGQPKGVMVEHRSVVNLLWSMLEMTGLKEADRLLSVTTFAFDIAALEFYMPLLCGAQLCLLSSLGNADPSYLADKLESYAINMMQGTPATWRMLLDSGWRSAADLKALCGGEALPSELAVRLRNQCAATWNVYGPTETTIWSASLPIDTSGGMPNIVPIGRPIANTQMYILDARREPVPAGVTGELYIGGAGVARGYLNRPELTAERFLRDPFSREPGARMYRTGDLGRWLPDGDIEFLGRNDSQVKIRGFRIELAEIETRLKEDARIREAVVVAREDTRGDKRLAAYYTLAHHETSVEVAALRSHLAAALPEYMVPAAFVPLAALPLTPNGKLDRKSLPSPEADAYAMRAYEAPQGKIETALATVWAEVLKLDQVGRQDNFFELGGHSLSAVQVIAKLPEDFAMELTIRDLFTRPVLSDLAEHIINAQFEHFDPEDMARLVALMGASQ